jgi:hypothetical protein
MVGRIARAVGVAAIALALGGCPGFGDQTLAGSVDGTPTWEGAVKDVFKAQCWTCHGETACCQAPYSLFTYEQAYAHRDQIDEQCVQVNLMPPGVGLPNDQRAIIAAWLRGGAPRGEAKLDMGVPDAAVPDVGVVDAGGMDAGPPPTWADPEIGGIVHSKCATPGCHAADFPQGGLRLDTYANFVQGGVSGDLRGGGDPARSLLIDRLRARRGALMPFGGPALPEAQIRVFERWIAAGAPEGP